MSLPSIVCATLLLLAAWAADGRVAHAAEVHVAVAANFAAPMQRIARAFEEQTGHRALIALGATGALYAQARHGAPFGVFLAADEATPRRLEAEGLGVPGTRFTYAVGRLVLWSARPGVVDDAGAVLREGRIQRLALANPRLAPYGAAAVEVMTRLDVLEALRPRFVQGENIAQTHQFVASGNAEMGFVALSQVQVEGRIASGSAWRVPSSLHAPLRQDAILLVAGRDNPAARALLEFLRADATRALIRAHGYEF